MEAFERFVAKVSNVLYFLAGLVLTLMMLLTVADVILRYLGHPIPGTYELVALGGALVIGFSIPQTSIVRGHVYVEFLIEKMEKARRSVVLIFTKILILLLFIAFTIYLYKVGTEMSGTGEVTQILELPIYPICFMVGACCFLESLVMVCDIKKLVEGRYE